MVIKELSLPLSEKDVLELRAGDVVSITGNLLTGRDRIHRYLVEKRPPKEEIPFELEGGVIYHCGPLTGKDEKGYRVISAGPTTSMRVEMYEEAVIRDYNLRGIMGKGGMGKRTLAALKEYGCVYMHTFGGAAVYLADRIIDTIGVWKLDEFGPTEAMWCFGVKGFPAVVTMDAHGKDMHREIEDLSFNKFSQLIR